MSGTTQRHQYQPMKVTNLKQLALEFIVIFLGVSASFGVTSFSQMRFEKTEENRLLEALTTEIETIREYEARASRDVSDDIAIYSELLKSEGMTDGAIGAVTSSKTRIEFSLFNNSLFSPPTETYTTLIASDGLKYIRSNALKTALTNLHIRSHNRVTTGLAEERLLKATLLDEFLSRHPSFLIQASDPNVSVDEYLDTLAHVLRENQTVRAALGMQLKYLKSKKAALQLYELSLGDLETALKQTRS
jgi:hypothetical protein